MAEFVTTDDVLARLRKQPTDPDAEYIGRCTAVANQLVTAELERDAPPPVTDPPTPRPPLEVTDARWRAALGVAIRVYRFKDAESDVSDTWGDTGALRIPRDPLAGYRDLLTPGMHGSTWAPA